MQKNKKPEDKKEQSRSKRTLSQQNQSISLPIKQRPRLQNPTYQASFMQVQNFMVKNANTVEISRSNTNLLTNQITDNKK
jgi:hypothetical protein